MVSGGIVVFYQVLLVCSVGILLNIEKCTLIMGMCSKDQNEEQKFNVKN